MLIWTIYLEIAIDKWMRKDFSLSRPLSMGAVVQTNLQGVFFHQYTWCIKYIWSYGLENVNSKHANPFDQPTNQTSSLSSTFSVKGLCSENADFAFAEFEFESTLVTEWNWVIFKNKITVEIFVTAQYCRTPQTSYVQLFYIFGLFVGSFLLGRVADRCL